MTFLHPLVLLGLPAALLPLLLHLITRKHPPTVVFPAVRYLVAATKQHERRLRLRHLLLLAVRVLLVATVILAAAGPTVPISGIPGHLPSALVVVLDNSASSGVVAGGTVRLDQLRSAARGVIERATPEDRVWLLLADAVPRMGDRESLAALVDSAVPSDARLDLGAALQIAAGILDGAEQPGEIFLVSDLQASAVTAAAVNHPLVVVRPEGPTVDNLGLASIGFGRQPWSTDGGTAVVSLSGDAGLPASVSLGVGDTPRRQSLASVGSPASVRLAVPEPGWWPVEARLDPDELRADDRYVSLLRVAPVARAAWDPADKYLAAAAEVLEQNGRLARGTSISLGVLGGGPSIVQPPADPAELSALKRRLARRGLVWNFGDLETAPTATDSGPTVGRHQISRRYRLESSGSGVTGVLATAAGQPWMVRDGDVILVASRLEPEWTDLPLSAEFVPLLDRLLNRVVRGEIELVDGSPGEPVTLPDRTTAVLFEDRTLPVEGGSRYAASEVGLHLLVAGLDTIGVLAVNVDPRESMLERAGDDMVRDLWHPARIVEPSRASTVAFAGAARGDLRSPLLWFALLLGLVEVALASGRSREE